MHSVSGLNVSEPDKSTVYDPQLEQQNFNAHSLHLLTQSAFCTGTLILYTPAIPVENVLQNFQSSLSSESR